MASKTPKLEPKSIPKTLKLEPKWPQDPPFGNQKLPELHHDSVTHQVLLVQLRFISKLEEIPITFINCVLHMYVIACMFISGPRYWKRQRFCCTGQIHLMLLLLLVVLLLLWV